MNIYFYRREICIISLTVLFYNMFRTTPCGRGQRKRRNQVLAKPEKSQETINVPSRYRSDLCSNAPPAYDDVINKPEDYPTYHAQGKRKFIALHLVLFFGMITKN